MAAYDHIVLPLQVVAVGGDSRFAGLCWTTLRDVGASYDKLVGVGLGRKVIRAQGIQPDPVLDWRGVYHDYLDTGLPAVFVLHGVDRLEDDAIGQTLGEFALIAGGHADNQLLLAHEVGHLLGLRHEASGFMRPRGLDAGGPFDGIHSQQRRTARENAWLWGSR